MLKRRLGLLFLGDYLLEKPLRCNLVQVEPAPARFWTPVQMADMAGPVPN